MYRVRLKVDVLKIGQVYCLRFSVCRNVKDRVLVYREEAYYVED